MKKFIHFIFLLFIYTVSFSQGDFTQTLSSSFAGYQQQALPEKIFMHTDKDFYVAGEIIWFKLYDVDGIFHKPLTLSKVAYVEVIAADSNVVLHAKLPLANGLGNGSFMLPASLNTGSYVIRTYTSWMKNFPADYFFQKNITIINTQKKPDWQKNDIARVYELRFFPEGGNLVNGTESKIGFKLADQTGAGTGCKGFILNQRNDTVTTMSTHRLGMGQFKLKPAAGESYHAVVLMDNGQHIQAPLPAAYASGYVMSLQDTSDGDISVSVANISPSIENTLVYLFVHTRQKVGVVLQKVIKSGKATFILNKQQLGEGISHITLFDPAHQPVCERLFFRTPANPLRISITPESKTFGIRSKVTLDIETANSSNAPSSADLSLSVFLLDSLQHTASVDISSYLWLTSDLRGWIESPAYYFNDTSINGKRAMENLLLTQGWRRFRWEEVMKNSKPLFQFLPEYEGHVITAKTTHRKTGEAVPGAKAFLSVPGNSFQVSSTAGDEKGMLRFVVGNTFGQNEIVVQSTDSAYQLDVATPFSADFTGMPKSNVGLSEKWQADLLKHSLSAQTANAFSSEQQRKFFIPASIDTTAFYGVPDKTYYLDNYTRFTTMEEVLREYVPEVRVRKQNDLYHYQVKNTVHKTYFSNDPLVLLDGVPVTANSLMAFDPLKIKKLEVVAREYFASNLDNEGIVSFSTYDGDLGGYEVPSNAIILEYEGLQLKREFYHPVYESAVQKQSRLPDFRNMLHWLPDVLVDNGKKQVTFYTSDLPGIYAIVVQGIDQQGASGSAVVTFEVKK